MAPRPRAGIYVLNFAAIAFLASAASLDASRHEWGLVCLLIFVAFASVWVFWRSMRAHNEWCYAKGRADGAREEANARSGSS